MNLMPPKPPVSPEFVAPVAEQSDVQPQSQGGLRPTQHVEHEGFPEAEAKPGVPTMRVTGSVVDTFGVPQRDVEVHVSTKFGHAKCEVVKGVYDVVVPRTDSAEAAPMVLVTVTRGEHELLRTALVLDGAQDQPLHVGSPGAAYVHFQIVLA